jgi:hypothetical protein
LPHKSGGGADDVARLERQRERVAMATIPRIHDGVREPKPEERHRPKRRHRGLLAGDVSDQHQGGEGREGLDRIELRPGCALPPKRHGSQRGSTWLSPDRKPFVNTWQTM